MSFFKNIHNNFYYNREQLIKKDLISKLNECIKEIHLQFVENDKEFLEETFSINTLCTVLEAIFIHGIKDSILLQTLSAISEYTNDDFRKPEPNFWPLLLIFLHAHTIEQIENLSQIKTDIGNCRAWIRLSLNESLCSSYLQNIKENHSTLNPYYKSYAFLKDSEQIDIAIKLLKGFESSVNLKLHFNSTLLNQWTMLPLQLAGLYSPPLESYPITSGIDIANTLIDTDIIPIPKALKINEIFTNSISHSPLNRHNSSIPSLTSVITTTSTTAIEETLKHDQQTAKAIVKLKKYQEIQELKKSYNIEENYLSDEQPKTMNYSLSNETELENNEFIKDLYNIDNLNIKEESITNEDTRNAKANLDRLSNSESPTNYLNFSTEKLSYAALLIKHKTSRNNDRIKIIDMWESFESSLPLQDHIFNEVCENSNSISNKNVEIENKNELDDEFNDLNSNDSNSITDENNLGFVILPKLTNNKFTLDELQTMIEHICKLAREKGVDAQGFKCKSCMHPIGIGFANAYVCAFSGFYFCKQCMSSELFLIPAKIIYNWDFRKYNVSTRVATFLTDFQYEPFIDLKILNPKIYESCEEMAMLQSVRIKLNFIRAYLYTCCESISEALRKQVYDKEYLLKHIHQYSTADLLMIPKGNLYRQLEKTYKFGEEHVLKCNLCSVKGFNCEICRSPKILYPFHISTTFRCELCNSVFHDTCLDQSKPCPKCRRKRERENIPLEAVHLL